MTTHDLAKDLDGLARSLRSLTGEASEAVAKALELERRRGYSPANKFEPKALTVAAISAAIAAATCRPSVAVELRKDVFERRISRNATIFADQFALAVKSGQACPAGQRFVARFTGLPAGVRSLFEAVPQYGKTAINADGYAWANAARYALIRFAPAYSYNGLELAARSACGGASDTLVWNLRDKYSAAMENWLSQNSIVLCDVDAGGRVLRFNGLDPAPFVEVLRAVKSGNADPLGIFKP